MNLSATLPNHVEYYSCGLAMNHAWREASMAPCSDEAYKAQTAMHAVVPVCSKLRQGDGFVRSYEALLIDSDTWCGFPGCKPPCADGVSCHRLRAYPFEPACMGPLNVTKAAEPKDDHCIWFFGWEPCFGHVPKFLYQVMPTLDFIIFVVATYLVIRWHYDMKQENKDPHCSIWSVLCCLCCTPFVCCFPIDARKSRR